MNTKLDLSNPAGYPPNASESSGNKKKSNGPSHSGLRCLNTFGVETTIRIIAGKSSQLGSLGGRFNAFLSRNSQASNTHCGVSSSSSPLLRSLGAPVPVIHTDFTSQYPTGNALLGNWNRERPTNQSKTSRYDTSIRRVLWLFSHVFAKNPKY